MRAARTARQLVLAGAAALALTLGLFGCSGVEERPVFSLGPEVWTDLDPDWTVAAPLTTAEQILAVCALPTGEAWAVGTGGLVLRRDGAGWRREESGTTATLLGVAASADGRLVCAAGANGTLLVREGGAWRRAAPSTGRTLRAVAVDASGAAWAAGDAGTLLRVDAAGWRAVPWPADSDISSLAAWGDTLLVGTAEGEIHGLAGGGSRLLGAFPGREPARLAVSPAGAVFAATDSVCRYDAGRWVSVYRWSVKDIAATDQHLFLDGYVHDHSGATEVGSPGLPGDERVCAAGPDGALAVGPYGHTARWTGTSWAREVADGLSGSAKRLADGEFFLQRGSDLLAWADGAWRVALTVPADFGPASLVGGLDAGRLLFYGSTTNRYHVLDRAWRTLPQLPDSLRYLNLLTLTTQGAVVARGQNGLLACDASGWRVDRALATSGLAIVQTAAGETFAARETGAWRWDGAHWLQETTPQGRHYSGDLRACAGRFPDSFLLLSWLRWRPWTVAGDTLAGDWRLYGERVNQMSASVEVADAVFIATEQPSRVLRRPLPAPASAPWTSVTGPLPDQIAVLRIEPDGSLTAYSSNTGRVWRHPAPRGY